MKANVRYIICNDEGYPMSNIDTGETIEYTKYRAAEKVAKQYAEKEPGKAFFIFEHVTEVRVPGGEAEVYRRYPLEHYK